MKKYLLIATVIALGLSVAACTGKKGENAQATDESTKQEEVVAPTTNSVDENDVLAKYENLIDKLIDLQDKVAKGDAASVEELTKLNEEATALNAELQNAVANFTPEQTQKFTELAQKWAAAAAKNLPQQ